MTAVTFWGGTAADAGEALCWPAAAPSWSIACRPTDRGRFPGRCGAVLLRRALRGALHAGACERHPRESEPGARLLAPVRQAACVLVVCPSRLCCGKRQEVEGLRVLPC